MGELSAPTGLGGSGFRLLGLQDLGCGRRGLKCESLLMAFLPDRTVAAPCSTLKPEVESNFARNTEPLHALNWKM